jgi:predicted Zn-dependent protease
VAASSINLSDAPAFPRTFARSYDAEGVPKRPLPLIQDGVAHAVVHDLRSAAAAGDGARSTGHALEVNSPHGPVPTNLVLIGGGAEDEDALAAPIERGL